MARGHQKEQSRQKNAKKQAEQSKKKGADQRTAAAAALHYSCYICKTLVPDPKTYKTHFENKHPKSAPPPEIISVYKTTGYSAKPTVLSTYGHTTRATLSTKKTSK